MPAVSAACKHRAVREGSVTTLRTVRGLAAAVALVTLVALVARCPVAMAKVSLHWFRKGLRLHDNPALLDACRGASQIYPVFVLDPHFVQPEKIGPVRFRFLLQSLEDLDQSLRARGSRLFVVKGTPEEELPRLLTNWQVNLLTFERDTEPYAKVRDDAICRMAHDVGVEVMTHGTHTLHDPEHYQGVLRGKPMPSTYNGFLKVFSKMPTPAAPMPAPDAGAFPADGSGLLDAAEFNVPTLEEIGYEPGPDTVPFPGGETEALARLQRHMVRKSWVLAFEKPKTRPNALEPDTTVLSPYMKFGCLSPRVFWHELEAVLATSKNHTAPPVSLHGQLLWREFFTMMGATTPNFGQMVGNPICKQIDWDVDEEFVAAWEEARTGYPFIDAIMTQLRQEGWIHHLARHAVACFLTRGDLYQSWEVGARIFDKHLIDGDWALNNANWMWLSCSSFFYQYFRCYSPVAFGKKTDPDGAYIKKWLPQLANFPKKYIYEPWNAPKHLQKQWGCVVGVHYPERIVIHETISKTNMARLKVAYAANKAGATAPPAQVSSSAASGSGNGPAEDTSDGAARTPGAKAKAKRTGSVSGGSPKKARTA